MAKYHEVITQEVSEDFTLVKIKIYGGYVLIQDLNSCIEISRKTANLLAQVIQKGQ